MAQGFNPSTQGDRGKQISVISKLAYLHSKFLTILMEREEYKGWREGDGCQMVPCRPAGVKCTALVTFKLGDK